MIEAATFTCSICSEPSTDICVACTKDACWNHRCERCRRCSDCCECEVPLTVREAVSAEPPVPEPIAEPVTPGEQISDPSIPEYPAELFVTEPVSDAVPNPPWQSEEPDSSWLAPPEATEEPDLNTPPAPVLEQAGEQQPDEDKFRAFPTNSIQDEHEGAD